MGGQHHAPAALPPGKARYPLHRRLGGPQGRSGRVRKISPPTGIRSPDRPARSESLYRLSYPGRQKDICFILIVMPLQQLRKRILEGIATIHATRTRVDVKTHERQAESWADFEIIEQHGTVLLSRHILCFAVPSYLTR